MHINRTTVQITVEGDILTGDLCVPDNAFAIVLFAHGSGSSRLSSRNKFVASHLNSAGFATLLIDLLTSGEELIDQFSRQLRFNIEFLAKRLNSAIEWIHQSDELKRLPIGLFGASTGSAAAIVAAAENPSAVSAVVSRGGRPDLANESLKALRVPLLLIVGGADYTVIDLNKSAASQLYCEHKLEIVSGATHLFEEPGSLERVASLATQWFIRHFCPPSTSSSYTPRRNSQ